MKIYLRFIPMITIMGIIFYLSHQQADFVQLPLFTGSDMVAHFIAYGCLAAAFLYGLQSFADKFSSGIAALVVVLFCLLFGISDEFHQSFIPGRFVSFWDVAADVAGALLIASWWMIRQAEKDIKPGG